MVVGEIYIEMMKSYQDTQNDVSTRCNIRQPIPMVIGTDSNIDRDMFTIEKFSRLQQDLVEMVSFAGYRRDHSTVQVGRHLYILGGDDADGNTMNRMSVINASIIYMYSWYVSFCPRQVQRVDIRKWTVEELPPMQQARTAFSPVYLDGSIYTIGANFDRLSTKNVLLSVERYFILSLNKI